MKANVDKELMYAIMRADEQALRLLFKVNSREERISLAKAALIAYRDVGMSANRKGPLNAVLATATAEQLKKLSFSGIRIGDLFCDFLLEQKPLVLQDWVDERIAQLEIQVELVSELVIRGLCSEPISDEYVMQLMGSLRIRGFSEPVVPMLRRDKRFCEYYVWRLFEVEGNGENSLAANDKYSRPESTWEYAIIELSREKVLDREKLLDASLDALSRDFHQFRAGWYSRFHEAMEPTLEERHLRITAYASLLASSIPTTVGFALQALTVLAKAKLVDANVLVYNLSPVLSAKTKSLVGGALALIEIVQKNEPGAAIDLCNLAADGFLHESPDVQNRIAKLLTKYGSRDCDKLRAKVNSYKDYMAPSVRQSLHEWFSEPPTSPESNCSVHYEEKSAPEINPLETAKRMKPYLDFDELIAGCSSCLENPGQVDDIERALDGIVRLCSIPSNELHRISQPLQKRAFFIRESKADSVTFLQRLFASFVYCWLTNDANLPFRGVYNIANERFIHSRLSLLLKRVIQRLSVPLLSAPTHEHGWIEPQVVVERWKEFDGAGQLPDEYDQAICLLRLPLGQLRLLLPEYASIPGRFWDAVRFATKYSEAFESDDSLLWQAASSYRTPAELAAFFSLGTGALFQQQSQLDFVRCLGIYFPAIRNQFVASGIRRVGSAIDWYDSLDRCVRAYIEIMLDPSFQFDRQAYHVLAAGLILAHPELAVIARDIVIQLIDANRLCIDELGREIGVFLYCGRSKTKRLVSALTDIAGISQTHSSAVRQLLERALHGGEIVPRDLFMVLELLNELLHLEGRTLSDPVTKSHLLKIRASGKAGKLIRGLTSAVH